jgi:hypothetical protein
METQTVYSISWSESYRMRLFLRASARKLLNFLFFFMVSESLFPVSSHKTCTPFPCRLKSGLSTVHFLGRQVGRVSFFFFFGKLVKIFVPVSISPVSMSRWQVLSGKKHLCLLGYARSVFLSVLYFLILSGRQTWSVGAFEGHGCVRVCVDTSTVVCLVCITRTRCVSGSLSESSSSSRLSIEPFFTLWLIWLLCSWTQ